MNDEILERGRFRSGSNELMLVLLAMFGFFWFCLFCAMLLSEPTAGTAILKFAKIVTPQVLLFWLLTIPNRIRINSGRLTLTNETLSGRTQAVLPSMRQKFSIPVSQITEAHLVGNDLEIRTADGVTMRFSGLDNACEFCAKIRHLNHPEQPHLPPMHRRVPVPALTPVPDRQFMPQSAQMQQPVPAPLPDPVRMPQQVLPYVEIPLETPDTDTELLMHAEGIFQPQEKEQNHAKTE